MEKRKISFPHFGSYYIPIRHLMIRGLEIDYITPPPMTKKTLELGSKYSPDYVCAPFKIHLGCYIEAIEKGADTLIQVDGVCRLGYYGELHEQILRDLGHDVVFVNLARARNRRIRGYYEEFKKISPGLSLKKFSTALLTSIDMVESIDQIEDYLRKNIGFEQQEGSFDRLYEDYLQALSLVESRKEAKYITSNYIKRFKEIPVNKPLKPLRVGVVGEYYSIMDGFSNHQIEREMAKMGIVVDRYLNVSNSLFHYPAKKMREYIKGYSSYDIGATGTMTLDRALKFAKRGYDGIIHVKSFGCTPEIDAMPVLQNISTDYKIPILYFSFDSQTAEAGILTRLEAFYDMMVMRKEGKA